MTVNPSRKCPSSPRSRPAGQVDGPVAVGEQNPGRFQEGLPSFGEPDPAPVTGQQLSTDLLFQCPYPLAERRLAQVQIERSPAEVEGLSHPDEASHRPKIHPVIIGHYH